MSKPWKVEVMTKCKFHVVQEDELVSQYKFINDNDETLSITRSDGTWKLYAEGLLSTSELGKWIVEMAAVIGRLRRSGQMSWSDNAPEELKAVSDKEMAYSFKDQVYLQVIDWIDRDEALWELAPFSMTVFDNTIHLDDIDFAIFIRDTAKMIDKKQVPTD